MTNKLHVSIILNLLGSALVVMAIHNTENVPTTELALLESGSLLAWCLFFYHSSDAYVVLEVTALLTALTLAVMLLRYSLVNGFILTVLAVSIASSFNLVVQRKD